MRVAPAMLVATALLMGTTRPASAVIRIATYSGTLASGFDKNGLFGTPGADLAGLAITTAYTYDTARGFRSLNPGVSDELVGGATYGVSTPVFNTRITINGISRDIPGQTNSSAFTGLGYGRGYDSYDFEDTALVQVANGAGNFDADAGSALAFSLDQLVAPTGLTLSTSYFQFATFDKVNLVQSERTYGEWNEGAVYSVTGVPEPASWALMIAGFGLVGAGLRRRADLKPRRAEPIAR